MSILAPSRRGFLGGLIASIAAPAVVHAANLMPISVFKLRHASPSSVPGWFQCDGGLLRCDQYPELFNVIGKMYGGDGVTTFAVPDLRGRAIPGRFDSSNFVMAINTQGANGHLAGSIRTMIERARHPLPKDTKVFMGPFSGYHTFPPREVFWPNPHPI
jgi:hypothetical protein